MIDASTIRSALIEALPLTTSNYGEEPEQRLVYVPPAHIKALRLECNLIVGARGVGKSFWTAALGSASIRQHLGQSVRELEQTDVAVGYGSGENIDAYPSGDVFASLLDKGNKPYDVWRAVVSRWLAPRTSIAVPVDTWSATVDWVKGNPEMVAKVVQTAQESFSQKARFGLIVFDALDRSSTEWQTMDSIVRDLLRVVLWLKSFSRIHGKVFLREDQYDRTITDFPDASKLVATKAELFWAAHDLHGLLWQRLCNAPGKAGTTLRSVYTEVVGTAPIVSDDIAQLSEEVKRDTNKQRSLFQALAGPWMGRDVRRGIPYVWTVSHLADGRGGTSPRSFLAAINAAAENSGEKYPDHPYALHYESIKRGVQKASSIRVSEVEEDYPWVTKLMDPLLGLTVPCEFDVVEGRWEESFPDGLVFEGEKKLPPQHAQRGWVGVRNDLVRLGVFESMKDNRVNLPDLYRVGFGLGRRGGVKPIK